MVFPIVLYGCKSWIIKKAKRQRTDAFKLWWWRRVLSPLDNKEIKPVNPKGNQPWIFIGRTVAEAPVLCQMRWADSLEKTLMLGKSEGIRRKRRQRTRSSDGITNSTDMSLSKLWEMVETVSDFIFLGSKITVDGDCSHEIKRCLFLGRKLMTNLS